MRLHRNQVPGIARQMVKALIEAEDIEVINQREVVLDLESVMNSYLQQIDEIASRARDMAQQRGLPHGAFARLKSELAAQRGLKSGDDAIDDVLQQLVDMLMRSHHVEEVFGEDRDLKRRMRGFLRATDAADASLEAEVRSKLKHVKEGSRDWEIEYQRMKEEIKRRRGM